MKRYNLSNRRYIGSKAKLNDWIFENINKYTHGDSFFDIFAGTGVVSEKALSMYTNIYINDFLASNKVIYEAFFNHKGVDFNHLYNVVNTLNNVELDCIEENYFSDKFGGKYFGNTDARRIGYIRESLDEMLSNGDISKKEFYVLLASLIYSMDKIANTVGHYEAYIKSGVLDNIFKMGLINPIDTKNRRVSIFQEDSNVISRKIKSDIVFIDPPYNSRQYSRFYHVIENLVTWKKPDLFGVALKPVEDPSTMSNYCRSNAPAVFDDLISSLSCRFIVVTYNNTYNSRSSSSKNKISLEQIKASLNKVGKTRVLNRSHKFFNTGKTDFKDHQEYLFITEVDKNE